MNTITKSAASITGCTSTILAIDLGKYKSVACGRRIPSLSRARFGANDRLHTSAAASDLAVSVPVRMRPQGRNPALWSVARDAAFVVWHRAAGTLPNS